MDLLAPVLYVLPGLPRHRLIVVVALVVRPLAEAAVDGVEEQVGQEHAARVAQARVPERLAAAAFGGGGGHLRRKCAE